MFEQANFMKRMLKFSTVATIVCGLVGMGMLYHLAGWKWNLCVGMLGAAFYFRFVAFFCYIGGIESGTDFVQSTTGDDFIQVKGEPIFKEASDGAAENRIKKACEIFDEWGDDETRGPGEAFDVACQMENALRPEEKAT